MAITDFVEKYRSLAIFGGLVGGLLLAGLIVIFRLIERDDVEAVKVTQRQMVRDQDLVIEEQRAAIAKRQVRLAELEAYRETERKVRDADIEVAAAGSLVTDLQSGNEGLRRQIDALRAELAAYKDHYRQFARLRAKGEKLGTLTTRSDKTFNQAVIAEVDAVGLRVIHAEGKTRIPYEELPAALQDRFQFDSAQRDALLAREAAANTAHRDAADAATSAQQAQRKEADEAAQARHKEETERELAEKKDELAMTNAELLQLNRSLAEEQQKTSRNTGPIKARIAAAQQQRSRLQAEISRLQSEL
jgi:chromosome segregation ATPase